MFDVPAEAYGVFMGRWSEPLAERFVRLVDLPPGGRALDVGCGPGALTTHLVATLGEDGVSAVEPSPSFLQAARTRFPRADVREGAAEALPYDDDRFDVALAQLVVHFMADPVAGLREMRRVTRPGGTVAACVWDHSATGPLAAFWQAAHDLDPDVQDEGARPGSRRGDLVRLLTAAGLEDVTEHVLTVHRTFEDVESWWHPFTLGVGPGGAYVAGLRPEQRDALRARAAELLPDPPFTLTASAWAAVGQVGHRPRTRSRPS